jgi:hypothetical protein
VAQDTAAFAGVAAIDAAYAALGWIRPPVGFGVPEILSNPTPEQVGEVGDLYYERTSMLGTPVILPITIDGVDLPDNAVMTITGRNRIIETDLNSKQGTFKELWAKDDYRISIRGIVVQSNGNEDYPEDQLRQIKELLDAESHLPIECDMTTLFGITDVAIYDYNFPELPGVSMAQPFELMCKSDYKFELELDTNGEAQ